MKRIISAKIATAICLVLLIMFCLPGCKSRQDGKLTLATVRSMAAEKAAALTWSDFSRYPATETGSGLYILVYEIDGDYRLMIGGVPDAAPMYIYLVSMADSEQRIDIRYDDVDNFLNRAS